MAREATDHRSLRRVGEEELDGSVELGCLVQLGCSLRARCFVELGYVAKLGFSIQLECFERCCLVRCKSLCSLAFRSLSCVEYRLAELEG